MAILTRWFVQLFAGDQNDGPPKQEIQASDIYDTLWLWHYTSSWFSANERPG